MHCAVCGQDSKTIPFGVRSGFALLKCRTCGLVFLEQTPENIGAEFYSSVHEKASPDRETRDGIEYWSFPNFFKKHRSVFEHFFDERWRVIQRVNPHVDKLLDVGCGYGFFLAHMKNRISQADGLELDDQVAAFAREQYGLRVDTCTIEAFDSAQRYDCIVMCDVLEHLLEPANVLKRCHALLQPGGVLFVQVPNLVGLKLPLGHTWGLPHHLWQFGSGNLRTLVEKSGFSVATWYTGVMGVIGAMERGGPTPLEKITWQLARTFRLGNRLIVVAQKN